MPPCSLMCWCLISGTLMIRWRLMCTINRRTAVAWCRCLTLSATTTMEPFLMALSLIPGTNSCGTRCCSRPRAAVINLWAADLLELGLVRLSSHPGLVSVATLASRPMTPTLESAGWFQAWMKGCWACAWGREGPSPSPLSWATEMEEMVSPPMASGND